MAAAAVVAPSGVADKAGIIGVAGAGQRPELGVVLAVGIGVPDHGAQGSACGPALKDAGEDFRRILFSAGGGHGVLSGRPAGHFRGDEVHVQRDAGGEALQGHPNGGTVGLAENDIFHRNIPPRR